MAPGFIRARAAASIMPRVAGVAGQCRLTTSLSASRVSRSTNVTSSAAYSGRTLRVQTSTRIPSAWAMRAVCRPMWP